MQEFVDQIEQPTVDPNKLESKKEAFEAGLQEQRRRFLQWIVGMQDWHFMSETESAQVSEHDAVLR